MKHFKVQVPEGYEIDQEKSTFEKIVFKPVDPKPKWEDFGKVSGWYINANSVVHDTANLSASHAHRNIWPTRGEAEACLALSQLCQWRDKYNEGWKPDWRDSDTLKHVIVVNDMEFISGVSLSTSYVLTFKSQDILDRFFEDFRDLIEIAKPLI